MASTRKLRNVNKRFSKAFEDWPDKDGISANKSKNRKRKLSDMLGSQWSKEEVECFYEAYRKYGKDWRKIGGAIHNRSSEMVEALYNMNKAYLSLPEGTATAAGLIAMMTDHYNILEGSDSDRESIDVPRTSRKPQKRGRGKIRVMSKGSDRGSPDLLQSQSASSRYGCLSLLKKKRSVDLFAGNQPRAVGKRTPRIPVSNFYNRDDKEKTISLNRQLSKSEVDAADDEGAHVAALALAEVLQRGGSPQVSRTPRRRVDRMRFSPVKSGEERSAEPDMDRQKLAGVKMDVDCLEGSLGSREAENGDFAKDDNEGIVGTVEVRKMVKKRLGKKPKVADIEIFPIDDDKEACSGTEEGPTSRKVKDGTDMEIRNGKTTRGTKGPRKRSRQLFFGDENSALDALQTLADLSVNLLPASTNESESSTPVKEEQNIAGGEKQKISESPLTILKDKSKVSGKKERRYPTSAGSDVTTRRSSKAVKNLHPDANAISEMNQQACACIGKIEKRKGRPFTEKVTKHEFTGDPQKSESQKTEVSVEEGRRSMNKVRRVSQVSPLPKQGKFVKPQDDSSSSTDPAITVLDLTERANNSATKSHISMPTKNGSHRKISLQNAFTWKEFKSIDTVGDDRADRHLELKGKLSHCMSSKLLRRWCMFEWFYSALDYPWFAKSEFVEYLNHVRLGHVPRLTHVEWGVIRSSLGKPRRLSKQFLKEERDKLEQYRESVRMHYAELRAGLREGLPTDLARPLSVGQRVIACHPRTREIHDGSVLTVDRSRCRVQFDRPELGVEFVADIDCMPLDPFDNIPEALRLQNSVINKFCNGFSNARLDDRLKDVKIGSSTKLAVIDNTDGTSHVSTSNHPISTIMRQAKGDTIDAVVQAKATVNEVAVAAQQAMYTQPCTLSQIQERESDIRALAELSRALDKKEALLIELRHMNEEVSGKQKDGDTIKDLEHFRKQYATVLVQLRDANDQVASALLSLRQRNTYHGNSTHPWVRPMENSGGPPGPQESLNPSISLNLDAGSHVVEIVETSRKKARIMVDAAVEAVGTLNEGEDAFAKIGEALDLATNRSSGSGANMLGVHMTCSLGHCNSSNHDHTTSCKFELTAADLLSPKPHKLSDIDLQLPSELISSCVSTLLMIQNCTERQYPPAEIAQILDSAVASLQPCCPQNLPIYREIETCMGIIKNQMLALIPTPSTIPPEITIV